MDIETILTVGVVVLTSVHFLLDLAVKGAERMQKRFERERVGAKACEQSPEVWPRISPLATVPWSLRHPWFALEARRLARLGFREIGGKVEEMPTHSVPSRIFYAEEHRTYAMLFSVLCSPQVVFMSALDDASTVHTGCVDRAERSFDGLLDLGASGSLAVRLGKHLDAVDRWSRERSAPLRRGTGGYRSASARPLEGTMEDLLVLARRYYLVRFRPGHPSLDDEHQRALAFRGGRAAA